MTIVLKDVLNKKGYKVFVEEDKENFIIFFEKFLVYIKVSKLSNTEELLKRVKEVYDFFN